MKFPRIPFSFLLIFASLAFIQAQSESTPLASLTEADHQLSSTTNATMADAVLPMHLVDLLPSSGVAGEDLGSSIAKLLEYPQLALDYSIEGRVTLRCTIDATGKITSAEVIKGLGYGCDEAALVALEKMPVLQPAQKAGKAVAVSCYIPLDFSLR